MYYTKNHYNTFGHHGEERWVQDDQALIGVDRKSCRASHVSRVYHVVISELDILRALLP